MTGAELWEMIEDNLENTFSADAYKQTSGFVKRCRGIEVYFKIKKIHRTRGFRNFSAKVSGSKRIKLTRSSLSPIQGGSKKFGKNRRGLEVKAVDALRNYLKTRGTVVAV